MRVISQSEMIDIPYDGTPFHVGAGSGGSMSDNPMKWAIYANIGSRTYKMAEYSTRERAKEELRFLVERDAVGCAFTYLREEDEEELLRMGVDIHGSSAST